MWPGWSDASIRPAGKTDPMPTRDEDWHRLIEGEPNRELAIEAWHLFEAFVSMDSAKAAHDAIALADEVTVRRALMAAVVSRRLRPLPEQDRSEWMGQGARAGDFLVMFDFSQPPG